MIKRFNYYIAKLLSCFLIFLFFGFLVNGLKASTSFGAGDLIKGSSPSVYLIKQDNKRYLFPNERTYKTWYPDFSGVKKITDIEIREIPFGGNMIYRPGIRLLKFPGQPEVYKVEEGGILRHLKTPEVAASYYGSNWEMLVDELPEILIGNYKIGEPIETPAETLVEAPPAETPTEEQPPTEQPPLTKEKGTLVIRTAYDTPKSGIVIAGSTNVPFSKFDFYAYDEAIKIESLVLKINDTAYIDNIKEIKASYYVKDSNPTAIYYLLDSGRVAIQQEKKIGYFNIDQVIFTGLNLVVPANQSRSITIKVDLNPIENRDIYPGYRADSGDAPRFTFVRATGRGQVSGKEISEIDAPRGFYQNKTTLTYPMIVRKTVPTFKLNTATPSGPKPRAPFSEVLRFDISANPAGDVKIKELKFKITTSDIDREGLGLANDYLEKLANVNGDFFDDNDIVNLYAVTNPNYYFGEGFDGNIQFSIYDWSAKFEDTTPVGFETDERDYGLIKFIFAPSHEILVPAGQTITLVLELYTSPLHSSPQILQVELLAEVPNAHLNNNNIEWNDGKEDATGYLVRELPVLGRTLYFE